MCADPCRRILAGTPMVLLAWVLAACSQQPAPARVTPPVPGAPQAAGGATTAEADQSEMQARENGYSSAAEEARARTYGDETNVAAAAESPEAARR